MLNRKARTLLVAGLVALSLTTSTAAFAAAPPTPSGGSAVPEGVVGQVNPVPAGTIAPLVNTTCGLGTYFGTGSSGLSNGTLSAAFCHYAGSHGISQVNIEYKKTSGDPVTLRFAWEFTAANGSSSYSRQYDAGAFTESTGQTKTYTWQYADPGLRTPTSNAPCVRGVLEQYVNGSLMYTFSTKVVCGL